MTTKLEVTSQETKPGTFNVVPKGKIDSETYLDFEEKLKPILEENPKTVVFDMAEVSYISSAGLGVVFSVMKRLKENDGELLLCNLQPQIRKVFEIVKALPSSSIFSSIEEADAYLEHMMSQELNDEEGKDKN